MGPVLRICQDFHYKPLFSRVYNSVIKTHSKLKLGKQNVNPGEIFFYQIYFNALN